jgi:hypothetical protein
MKNKREHERLGKMFSGIEVLAVNPAGQMLEIQPESEISASPVADLEQPALKYENSSFAVETKLFRNPQPVEEQDPDGLILPDNAQVESAPLNERTETPLASAVPLSDISNATPPPLTSRANTIVEVPIAHPFDGQVRANQSNPADWRDVGIGIVTGIMVTGIILAGTSKMDIFNNPGRFILLGWEVLCAIIGALAAKSSKGTSRAIWLGAIQWALVPVWIVLFILLMIHLLMFTNFFGL